MAKKTKVNRRKLQAKKSAKKVLTAKGLRELATVKKQADAADYEIPIAVVPSDAETRRKGSPMLLWASMPFAIMNLWLAPFERRT